MLFAYPQWRIFLLLAFAVAALAEFALVRKRRALRRLAKQGIHQPGILVRPGRQILKAALLAFAAGLLGIAVLGPQWGWSEEVVQPRQGRDVLIVLDVSRSMLAEDVVPNRLERAKADLRDLAGFLERAGSYRIGLIAFAERAAVMCPLTADYRCFQEELADVSLKSLRMRGHAAWGDGTQIRLALERVGQTIDDTSAAYTDVLLVSDGEDMAKETLRAAESLGRRSVAVHTFGLGDPSHGSLIPVHDHLGRPTHLHYCGDPVYTNLQETVLRTIAEITNGRYFAAGTSYRDLDRQFGELLAGKERRERQNEHRQRRGIHRFIWFVMPALLLLLLHGFLSETRRPGTIALEKPNYFAWVRRRAPVPQGREWTLAALIFLAVGSLATSAAPDTPVEPWGAFRRGNKLLRQAQQAGMKADAASLDQAQREYQTCLSCEKSALGGGTIFQDARYNLEMTKLLLMQIRRSGGNSDQADAKNPSSSQAQTRQQSQEKSENCSTCVAGQNRSSNGRKTEEGGKKPGPGKGTPSSQEKTESQTENDPSAKEPTPSDTVGENKPQDRGHGRAPDAGALSHAETPAEKHNQSASGSASQDDPTNSGDGKEKKAQPTDPRMQSAASRLQASIQRIEKRRGPGASGPESSPEDPANQNRYRDW